MMFFWAQTRNIKTDYRVLSMCWTPSPASPPSRSLTSATVIELPARLVGRWMPFGEIGEEEDLPEAMQQVAELHTTPGGLILDPSWVTVNHC